MQRIIDLINDSLAWVKQFARANRMIMGWIVWFPGLHSFKPEIEEVLIRQRVTHETTDAARERATKGRAARVLNFTDGVESCCGKEHALVFTQLVHASADSMEADETATEPWQRAGCSARKCR